MRINHKKTIFAAVGLSICGILGMSSCKGRTMENMEPTGDTVEVVIEQPEASDTLPASAGSDVIQ